MIFTPYSIAAMFQPEKLGLERAKDRTRRPAKAGECAKVIRWAHRFGYAPDTPVIVPVESLRKEDTILAVYDANGRLKWEVGRRYAIQPPPRGQFGIGHFTLASIGRELDVRPMSPEDVAREGFRSLDEFLAAWARFYGDSFFGPPLGDWILGMADVDIDESKLPPAVWQILEEYHDRTGP